MARRVITPTLFEDEWFGSLGDREQLVWVGIFGVLADDQGRLPNNPALIRSRLWPYRDVPAEDVAAAVERFVTDGRLHRYEVDGKALLQVVNWWRHQKPQWAMRSPLPAPPGWRDRVRTRGGGEYIEEDGWKTSGGFTCGAQVKGSGEPGQVSGSREPFGLAREQNRTDKTRTDKPSLANAPAFAGAKEGEPDDGFATWWATYARGISRVAGSKSAAHDLYRWWREHGADADELLRAAEAYRLHCETTDCRMKHAQSFLTKDPNRWREWAEGEEHGTMRNPSRSLSDAMTEGNPHD